MRLNSDSAFEDDALAASSAQGFIVDGSRPSVSWRKPDRFRRNASRRSSGGSVKSRISLNELKPQVLLQNVGRTLQRTHSQLQRTRYIHVFYVLALGLYSLVGAFLFQWIDGPSHIEAARLYDARCVNVESDGRLAVEMACSASSLADCQTAIADFGRNISDCYRRFHDGDPLSTRTHSMVDFVNAMIYAISVYTTIGYGNIAAYSVGGRVATVAYAIVGIPIFFAFIKDQGNMYSRLFVRVWALAERLGERCKCCGDGADSSASASGQPSPAVSMQPVAIIVDAALPPVSLSPPAPRQRTYTQSSQLPVGPGRLRERRRVFVAAVLFFVVYLFATSLIFMLMTDWDLFTSFYFIFNSVALIGMGDEFPAEPRVVLVNAIFIIIGIALFGMCYLILQEEVREKATVASARARMKISRYGQTVLQQTRDALARRNSPGNLLDSDRDFRALRKRRQSAPVVSVRSANGHLTVLSNDI